MDAFVAVDVETANSDQGSICQIGIARFDGGRLRDEWHSLVNPQCEFDAANIAVHHLTPRAVRMAPGFRDVYPSLLIRLEKSIVVSHTFFDYIAVQRACARYGLPEISCTWTDSCAIARQAWPGIGRGGYGLANLAKMFRIRLDHHDAASDAVACGLVVIRAVEHSGRPVNEWARRIRPPVSGERDHEPRARYAVSSSAPGIATRGLTLAKQKRTIWILLGIVAAALLCLFVVGAIDAASTLSMSL